MKPHELNRRQKVVLGVLERDYPLRQEDIGNIIIDHGGWMRAQCLKCCDPFALANDLFQRFSGGHDV
jgi:hypothetical protein